MLNTELSKVSKSPVSQRPAAPADILQMRQCLRLADRMLGRTSPNPAVGCVIVRAGRTVGSGATAPGGRPHAEALALTQAGSAARGATVFVSFEPCAHFGQTPPCARALIEARVRRVVIGCIDPDPRVRGKGVAMLRRAGIEVTVGVLEEPCLKLNEGFITRVRLGRPFTTLKLALSLDGRIAAQSGDSRWISSEQSRKLVHRWRARCDAVMVGAGTVAADNPELTCRLIRGHDPARVVIDGALRSPPSARLFHHRSPAPTLLVTSRANCAAAKRRYGGPGVEVIGVPARGREIALDVLMRLLADRGWTRVMIEGGARLAGSALRAGIVDEIAFFLAPLLLGSGRPAVEGLGVVRVSKALGLEGMTLDRVGRDLMIRARVARLKGKDLAAR